MGNLCPKYTSASSTLGSYLTLYTPYLGFYLNISLAVVSTFVIAGIAAIVFPYSKRARPIYEQAPAIVRKKVGGIPIVIIFGMLTTIIFSYLVYLDIASPALSGPVSPSSVGLIGGVYVLAVVVYLVSKGYHRKRYGIDIDMAFRELPPE
jgi:hypothetical protein